MGFLQVRDLLAYPNGDNLTDTVINGVHFNRSALEHWNYTLYTNNTLSNVSNCFLVFGKYAADGVLANGTFVNATNCYVPILPLKTRGRLGAVFGALFGISIMFTLINLKRHGQQFLREDRRFRLIGRRWQWYWLLVTAGCGMISTITAIDVDRDYLQDLAIILSGFFFMCMGQAIVAAVWEGVRHWGSWQERQIVDRDPFSLGQDDTRGKIEFYMPLVFYLFTFMGFFLTAPRSWTKIPRQGGIVQQSTIAEPAATDGRFKAGSVFLCASWLMIVYCVHHNLYHYRLKAHPSETRIRKSFIDAATVIRHLPIRFTLCIPIVAVYIAYGVAEAWNFDISILKYNVGVAWPFALGYTPVVVVAYILIIWGFLEPNEDKELLRQRVMRGRSADEELGYNKKPSWWSKSRGDTHLDDMDRLQDLVADANVTSNQNKRNSSGAMEMGAMKSPRSPRAATNAVGRTLQAQVNRLSLPGNAAPRPRSPPRGRGPMTRTVTDEDLLSPTDDRWDRSTSPSTNSMASGVTGTSQVTGTTLNTGERQQVRSMLDI